MGIPMGIPTKNSGGAGLVSAMPKIPDSEPHSSPPGELLVANPGLAAQYLFNTMIVYGPTGSRKTSQIGEFAKYIYEKTGKITRLISMDGGGWAPIQDLINVGIIEAWRLVEEDRPKLAVQKASQGAWPVKLMNGLRASNEVVLPTKDQRVAALKNVGAYAIDGLTSIATAVMRDCVAKGQKISEDIVSKFEESDPAFGTSSFGAPARAHYGFVQNFILDMIRNFSSLPVERVLYTALEGKGEDRLTKALQYGPQVAGAAITAAVPTYVGDCLHFEDYYNSIGADPNNPNQKLVEMKVRCWFTSHPDPQNGVIWPAKSRVVPEMIRELKKRLGENGYFDLTLEKGLYAYLKAQDALLLISTDNARGWKLKVDTQREATQTSTTSL